jgi:hypothetical protein
VGPLREHHAANRIAEQKEKSNQTKSSSNQKKDSGSH